MKKSYISLAALTGLAFLGLVSCGDKKENKKDTTTSSESSISDSTTSHFPTDTTTSTDLGTASLKVIDFDGEVVFDGEVNAGDTLYNTLINTQGIELVAQSSSWLSSINGTIMDDPNLSLMIYENDALTNDTADTLMVDDGDIIEIKNEFWNTQSSGWGKYDDVDVLLDKSIYHYVKTAFKDATENNETAFGSTFWEYLLSELAIENGYDVSLFNVREAKEELIDEVKNFDFSSQSVSATDFFKYYYTALGIGGFDYTDGDDVDKLNLFKAAYQSCLNSNPQLLYDYNQYSSPFVLSLANKLEIGQDSLNTIVQNTDKLDIERGQWGNYTDQLVWQVLTFNAIQGDNCKITDSVLTELNVRDDEFNATSLAASVAAFAAYGVNPRAEEYEKDGKDIIESIMENFYDEETGLIKVEKNDTVIPNFSTNQIYTYLFAYKISRDKNNAKINIFA